MIFLLLSESKYFGIFDTEHAAFAYAYDYYLYNNCNITFELYSFPYKIQVTSVAKNIDSYKTHTVSNNDTFLVTDKCGFVLISRKIDAPK